MTQTRAADDYASIRARLEELRQTRLRVADDFAAIRARMEELRRERVQAGAVPQERHLISRDNRHPQAVMPVAANGIAVSGRQQVGHPC